VGGIETPVNFLKHVRTLRERILRPCSLHNRLELVFPCIKRKLELLLECVFNGYRYTILLAVLNFS
jgi:hypothetical protein